MRIFLLQHNPIPGDFKGNLRQLASMAKEASTLSLSGERILCITPAYALAGEPWSDLRHIGGFYSRCRESSRELASLLSDGPDMLISFTGSEVPLYALLSGGNMISLARTPGGLIHIPDGPVFYLPKSDPTWAHQEALGLPSSSREAKSADAILFTMCEPFSPGAQEQRENRYAALARLWNRPVIAVQQYGATDSLIYSGQSFAINAEGELVARAPAFEKAVLPIDLTGKTLSTPLPDTSRAAVITPEPQREEALFRAAVLGIHDYVHKSGMTGVVLGLSGGMDSALVACMAVEALGAENVLAVLMPSRWSSDHSETDAAELAHNLGIETRTARITPAMDAFASIVNPLFKGLPSVSVDLTAENLQPRIRGTVLMAFANHLGRVVLATGNKSESAMGYCTLYGDTVGAIEPIGDLYKTEVYEVGRWYNQMRGQCIIPEHIFTKAPSAELHPGQKDEDSLPPYDLLDTILHKLLEHGANPETLVVPGVPDQVVHDVVHRLAMAEFKRHQCPPALKLSACTLGLDWHLPVTSRLV